MATEPKSRRRKRKKVIRRSDGALYDLSERRRITPAELKDYVRDGGLFEARRHESGTDCTYEVLQEVIGTSLLANLLPGLGGGGGGALGGIVDLVRALGDSGGVSRSGGGGWDDWEESSRRPWEPDDRGWGDSEPTSEKRKPWREAIDWADAPEDD